MTPRWGYCDATPTELSCTPSAYTIAPRANTRLHPERSRGVGVYNTFLVSASLDEQCLVAPRAEPRGRGLQYISRLGFARRTMFGCTPSGAEVAPRAEPRLHPERSRGVILHFHINKNPLLKTRAGFSASIQNSIEPIT